MGLRPGRSDQQKLRMWKIHKLRDPVVTFRGLASDTRLDCACNAKQTAATSKRRSRQHDTRSHGLKAKVKPIRDEQV